jgi:hypothetical protein
MAQRGSSESFEPLDEPLVKGFRGRRQRQTIYYRDMVAAQEREFLPILAAGGAFV